MSTIQLGPQMPTCAQRDSSNRSVRFDPEESPTLWLAGPELAAEALRAGLVDEIHLFLNPIIIGAGNPALPTMSPCRSSCSTIADSPAASCTGGTGRRADAPRRKNRNRTSWTPAIGYEHDRTVGPQRER